MSTIAAGQAADMTRSAALEFSFLVSIPVMIAATGYELLKTIHPENLPGGDAIAPLVIDTHGWIVLAIGLRGLFPRGIGSGGMVPAMGPPPRLRHLRRLPGHLRVTAAGVWRPFHGPPQSLRQKNLSIPRVLYSYLTR